MSQNEHPCNDCTYCSSKLRLASMCAETRRWCAKRACYVLERCDSFSKRDDRLLEDIQAIEEYLKEVRE